MGRRRKVKFGLRYKIAILIFSLVIITMGVVFAYTINMNLKMQEREVKRNARKVAESLSALRLVTSWKSEDVNWAVYEKYMDILSKLDRNILLMAIRGGDKNIMASSVNTALIKKDFEDVEIKKGKKSMVKGLINTKIKDVLKIEMPITIKGEDFAGVVIKFSKKANIQRINIMIANMVILTVILLAAGFAGAWLLSRLITGNFNIIAAGMRKVARGNLNVEVNVKSNDETGVLADDFNRMIVELREKVRIKDAFETVADGLKDMDDLKKAYNILTYQEMTDKITKGYTPPAKGRATPAVFVFIDTSSFSAFTYELISDEMKEIIEKFVSKISMTALEYQGAVYRVTENYVLLSFGYPFIHEDDAKRALISTVEIRKELVSMVKGRITLGCDIEDFSVNFILLKGSVTGNFLDPVTAENYKAVHDYLKFAGKYGEKKKYSVDVYTAGETAGATEKLAEYESVDSVALSDGSSLPLYRLKGTKF